MAHLLLIDDDPVVVPEQVRQAFPAPRYRVEVAGTGAEGLERVRAGPPDVILLDLRLPDLSGLEVYEQIRQIDARIPVIFVTLAKSADTAIEAMKQGAYDYLFKPLDLHQLRRVVGEALEVARRMREPAVLAEAAADPDVEGAIGGSCPAMREVYTAIGRAVLYCRLSAFTSLLQPRGGGGGGLARLVGNYVRRVSRELGREVREAAAEVRGRLRGCPWPVHMRELERVLQQALLQVSVTV